MPAQVNIEVRAQVDDAVRNLGALNKSYDVLKNANRDAAGALGVFGVSLTALNSPLTAIASGIKDSIDTTLNWANTIDKLSRATGESAAETSQMAVVFEDFGIKADSLDKVIKQFTKNGLQFNMETIKQLAKEYQAIQDPVERDKFAFDNFGRSGLELTEILSKSETELQAVGDAALYSGKIMDEQGVEAAQHFGVQLAQLNDQLDGLKIEVGGPLVDGLTSAINAFHALTGIVQANAIQTQEHIGIISNEEAAIRAAAAAHGDLWAASRQLTDAEAAQLTAEVNVTDAVARHTQAEQYQSTALDVGTLTAGAHASAIAAMSQASVTAQLATEDLTAKLSATQAQEVLNIATGGELTNQIIFQTASVGLSSDQQLTLARSLGLVNEATLAEIRQIEGLKAAHDQGKITTDAFISGVDAVANHTSAAANSVNNLAEQIAALHDKTVTVTVNTQSNGYFEGSAAAPGRASGGPVSSGQPYVVGENGPEMFVPDQSGQIVNNYNTTHNYNVNATYGNQAPGTVAQQLRLMSKLNR